MPKTKRTLIVGDIHGHLDVLKRVLDKAKFSNSDTLVGVGDYVDRGPDNLGVVAFLAGLKNFVGCLGNHDVYLRDWLLFKQTFDEFSEWMYNGGKVTVDQYHADIRKTGKSPHPHRKFLEGLVRFYKIDEDRVVVHAGLNPRIDVERQSEKTLTWDRELAKKTIKAASAGDLDTPLTKYRRVFMGHTPLKEPVPVFAGGVWMLDTAVAYGGCLTVMDADTEEYWQAST